MSYVVGGVELGRVITALDAGAKDATPSLVTYRTMDSSFAEMTERRRASAASGGAAPSGGDAGGGGGGGGYGEQPSSTPGWLAPVGIATAIYFLFLRKK